MSTQEVSVTRADLVDLLAAADYFQAVFLIRIRFGLLIRIWERQHCLQKALLRIRNYFFRSGSNLQKTEPDPTYLSFLSRIRNFNFVKESNFLRKRWYPVPVPILFTKFFLHEA